MVVCVLVARQPGSVDDALARPRQRRHHAQVAGRVCARAQRHNGPRASLSVRPLDWQGRRRRQSRAFAHRRAGHGIRQRFGQRLGQLQRVQPGCGHRHDERSARTQSVRSRHEVALAHANEPRRQEYLLFIYLIRMF